MVLNDNTTDTLKRYDDTPLYWVFLVSEQILTVILFKYVVLYLRINRKEI